MARFEISFEASAASIGVAITEGMARRAKAKILAKTFFILVEVWCGIEDWFEGFVGG